MSKIITGKRRIIKNLNLTSRDNKNREQYKEAIVDTMCYVTSMQFLEDYKVEKIKQKPYHFKTNKLFGKESVLTLLQKRCPICIDIHIKSIKTYSWREKMKLIYKYNIKVEGIVAHVFKKPNLRFFLHSFNIVYCGKEDRYLVLCSWFNIYPHHLIHRFTFNEIVNWLKQLEKNVNNFVKNSSAIYKMFKIDVDSRENFQLLDKLILETAGEVEQYYDVFYYNDYGTDHPSTIQCPIPAADCKDIKKLMKYGTIKNRCYNYHMFDEIAIAYAIKNIPLPQWIAEMLSFGKIILPEWAAKKFVKLGPAPATHYNIFPNSPKVVEKWLNSILKASINNKKCNIIPDNEPIPTACRYHEKPIKQGKMCKCNSKDIKSQYILLDKSKK